MPPERPVKLTFPSNDIGWKRIDVDGVTVGHVKRSNRCWQARLWVEAGNRNGGYADAPVVREYLRELRDELRERVALKGPWWTAG